MATAKGVYLTNDAFFEQAFNGEICEPGAVWLREQRKQTMQAIFARESVGLRQRYCRVGEKTAWVFNEIGKELPITIGVVVVGSEVEQVVVLAYRESRGGEIRHPFFTEQFKAQRLDQNFELTRGVDGITGATLSVNAMRRCTQAALYLHDQLFDG